HMAYELGWVADRYVVGITGPAIAPELYIACGIRGDAQHLAGMSDSRFVVAIHPDPQAPIFKTADLGVVGEPVAVLRALLGQA
ncbi:MAG: electron transfer flavoprotein subunit alpha, partial [Chloroflexota bacterium]